MKTKNYKISMLLLWCVSCVVLLFTKVEAQSQNPLQTYNQQLERKIDLDISTSYDVVADNFEDAYRQFPTVPRGVLEAVAFSYNRFHPRLYQDTLEPDDAAIPRTYGIMGLTLNGKGYFRENLRLISRMSGYSTDDILFNQKMAILAYAAAFAQFQQQFGCYGDTIELYKPIFIAMSEIPLSGDTINNFALNSALYAIYLFLNDPNNVRFGVPPREIDFEMLFGKHQCQILQKQFVTVIVKDYTKQIRNADYPNAVWNAAGSCNFSVGRNGNAVSDVVIHYTDGTYAGAVSWFQNCTYNGGLGSQVSAHYVIRSIDGQVTQMVREADKAWHVGIANGYTIGIEHEAYGNVYSFFTTAMYQSSADLVRNICTRHAAINPLHVFYRDTLDDGSVLNNGLHDLGGAAACPQIRGHQHFLGQSHYDPGPYWNWNYYYKLINNHTPISTATTVTGRFTDSGDSTAPYENDERLLFLIHVAGADSIALDFHSFDLERDYDFMWIYDGNSVFSPLLGRWNTHNPGRVVSSGDNLLVEFRSDCGTTADGWIATWTSYFSTPEIDHLVPNTAILIDESQWITDDFRLAFNDTDDVALNYRFYQIMEKNGNSWSANPQNGFFCDNFDYQLNPNYWLQSTNQWRVSQNALCQYDVSLYSTSVSATLNQNVANRFLFDFYMAIDTGNSCAFYFSCDRPLSQMADMNGYKLIFDKCNHTLNLYRITNGNCNNMPGSANCYITSHQNDLYRIVWDKVSGTILVFRHTTLLAEFHDVHSVNFSASYFGFQTCQAAVSIDNLRIYRDRENEIFCTVGAASNNLLQVEALAGVSRTKVKSVVMDCARKFSSIAEKSLKVDFTCPSAPSHLWDGTGLTDIDTVYRRTNISARWSQAVDDQSGIKGYQYAVALAGNSAPSMRNCWSNLGNTTILHTNQYYSFRKTFVVIRAIDNAGLFSPAVYTDGVIYVLSTAAVKEFAFYPNPASTQVTVRTLKAVNNEINNNDFQLFTCKLCNLIGETLYQTIFTDEATIPLRLYPAGVYILRITRQNQIIYQEKLIKQ